MPKVPGAPKKKGKFQRNAVPARVRKNLMSVRDEAFDIFRTHWLEKRVKTRAAANTLIAALKRKLTKQFMPKKKLPEMSAESFYGPKYYQNY